MLGPRFASSVWDSERQTSWHHEWLMLTFHLLKPLGTNVLSELMHCMHELMHWCHF